MSATNVARLWVSILISGLVVSAGAQTPEPPDSSRTAAALPAPSIRPTSIPSLNVGEIPLAPAAGYRLPRKYPRLDLGAGVRTFNPDLSGLSNAYDGTPSFGLSPMFCWMIELACADVVGLQADAGVIPSNDTREAFQGTAGLVAYLHPFANPALRPCLGAGVAVCSFRAEADDIITVAGETGFYVTAGLEYLLGPDAALNFYSGYCSYPRVSTTYVDYSVSGGQEIDVSLDLSNVTFGLRLKWLR